MHDSLKLLILKMFNSGIHIANHVCCANNLLARCCVSLRLVAFIILLT